MEQIKEAMIKACCHDFIMDLPEGYDTMIGEGGATISGGEKQGGLYSDLVNVRKKAIGWKL